MSGVAIIRAMLADDFMLTKSVPKAKIMAGVLPLNTVLPAISIRQISGVELKMIKRSGNEMVTDRVQVTVLATTYPQQKEILELIRSALPSVRGAVYEYEVDSILPDIDGPDLYSETPVIYEQSIDYIVRFIR